MKSSSAIILSGGHGKRMETYKPKCLVKLKGKPLIMYQLEWLKENNILQAAITCKLGEAKVISDVICKHRKFGNPTVFYVEEETALGTSGAVRNVLNHPSVRDSKHFDNFFVINGDMITDFKLKHLDKIGTNSIMIVQYKSDVGIVEIGEKNHIHFVEKPKLPHWINGGVYYLSKDVPFVQNGSLEYNVFPNINLQAVKHRGDWFHFTTRKDVEVFNEKKN